MKLIPVSEYNYLTMQLARPIYDSQYRILLTAGNSIHPKYLSKLVELGISYLFVEDKESRGITLEEMLEMSTWMESIRGVQEIYEQTQKKLAFPIHVLHKTTKILVSEAKRRKAIVVAPSTTIDKNLYPYAHAVNVALIALMIGKELQYNELQLSDLAVGCLLHDIGKIFTEEETQHPQFGFEFIRKIREINLLSAHIAYQHHETIDGSGYPRALTGNAILEYAQICAVANLFENMVSKDNIPPHEVIEFLMTLHGKKYAEQVIQAFCKAIPSYPPGTKVSLHNQEVAIVTKITSHLQRPVVRLLSTGEEISLVDHLNVTIQSLVKEEVSV